MKRPTPILLSIDLNIIPNNINAVDTVDRSSHKNHKNEENFEARDISYRHEGLSIGTDYLRLEGTTISRGVLSKENLSLRETIGRGAFCKVHRALWRKDSLSKGNSKDEVAIKQYTFMDGSTSQQKRKMLSQELRALCRLDCPSLVQFHGAFLESDTVTVVMEYMDRGSLHHILENRESNAAFSQAVVAGMAYQLLKGLEHLHNKRILHRDVKTENCLQNSKGSVKLCDFGLASLGDSSLCKTAVGTTIFMAPERLRGKAYSRSSDIWSIGLVFLHLATGKTPWSDVSSMVDLLVTIEETPASKIIPTHLEHGLKEIVNSCLQQTAAKRMPAEVILQSPWFSTQHSIHSVEDAAKLVLDQEKAEN